MAYTDRVGTVVPSATRTATGVSSAISLAVEGDSLSLLADVTAVSGVGPTLDLTVEWSHDGTSWAVAEPADSFAQITAAKTVAKTFTVKGPMYRVRWAIGGTTPSFTFSVAQYLAE